MRIYFSHGQDPMILDSIKGINVIHDELQEFLSSDAKSIYFEANLTGGPEMYAELLVGLEIQKGTGPINLSLTSDRRLLLVGSTENLLRYITFFKFSEDKEGQHHHPEYVRVADYIAKGSMSLIIETDSDYINGLEAKS